MNVESLEEQVDDARLNDMLEECFDIKPEPKQRKTPVVESVPTEPEEPEVVKDESNTYILINVQNQIGNQIQVLNDPSQQLQVLDVKTNKEN